MFQCFVAKFLITDIYSPTSEKQNVTLVLLILSAAMCNERMCLYCWTGFLTGVLVHNNPYRLCVDLSAKKSLEAGRWIQSNQKWSQLTRFRLGFQFAHVLCILLAPNTRHHNSAQGCDLQCCSEQLSPTHFCVTAAKVVRMSTVFPQGMVWLHKSVPGLIHTDQETISHRNKTHEWNILVPLKQVFSLE